MKLFIFWYRRLAQLVIRRKRRRLEWQFAEFSKVSGYASDAATKPADHFYEPLDEAAQEKTLRAIASLKSDAAGKQP